MNITDIRKENLSSAMQQYYDFKIEHLDKIVLFQLGDFFELFFEDAIKISQLLELTLTGKAAGLDTKIPMAGVPQSTLEDYLKKLLDHNLSVVVVVQDDANTVGKIVHRKISKIVTPGTYVDINNKDNVYTAVIYRKDNYAISYGDVSTGDVFHSILLNKDGLMNEILNNQINEIIDLNNVLSEDDITMFEHYNVHINNNHKINVDVMKSSLETTDTGLLEYFKHITQMDSIVIKDFALVDTHNHLQMTLQTQNQLELTKTLADREYKGSLFWYLNKTSTAMGRRKLKNTIIHPFVDEKLIIKKHKMIEELNKNILKQEYLTQMLKQVYDFERLIFRVNNKVILPKELNQLRESIKVLPDMKNTLIGHFGADLCEIGENIDVLEDLYQLLRDSLLEEMSPQVKDGNVINDGYDDEIDRLREIKDNSSKWLLDFEQRQRNETGIKSLKVKYNKIFGYFIEITNSFLNQVPEHYTRKQTMANCERFITEELKVAENDILNSSDKLIMLEQKIYSNIKDVLVDYIPRLQLTASVISELDLMISFAIIAVEDSLVKPIFNQNNTVSIINGFHPVVNKTVSNFVKNDLVMHPTDDILLITGPNMAGKSTYMRQVVLIAIMAQIGSYVPADSANIKIFDKIFTRIGASDDLAQGKSTFMVEMSETAVAINNATEDSLIVFDELGRGTSTYDGVALAQSIIEYIHDNTKAKTLFSTHYHELVDLEDTLSGLKNVHVKAEKQEGKLVFYHKVVSGGVQKSYGVEVAKLAKLPKEILERANEVILSLESNHNKQPIGEQIELFDTKKYSKNATVCDKNTLKLEDENLKLTEENLVLKEEIRKIKEIDTNLITPVEALLILNDFKNLNK